MRCTSCGGKNLEFIYKFSDAPALNNVFFKSRVAAQKAKIGVINLYGCKECGFVFNTSFDDRISRYTASYDNTQSASPYFALYIKTLARNLFKKYGLKNKRIVEVGCGKGQFLELLYKLGAKKVRGFDPTYVDYKPTIDKLVTRKYFNKRNVAGKVDVILCRHTLEHVPQPRKFVASMAACLAEDGVMYFEVPDLSWIVKHKTFFDFTYEHCNYFTPHSLYRLFSQFEFRHITLGRGLGGQYIQAEIRRGTPTKIKKKPVNFSSVAKSIKVGRKNTERVLEQLETFIAWGAGGKGVLFLNRLRIGRRNCPYIIDINENKQGKYIPGTTQEVVSPEILRKQKTDSIIIMNPIYKREIRKIAKGQGFKGHYITV